jgi:Lrp/AsnC family transcriptional regulator
MKPELDNFDHRILDALQQDGTLSVEALSECVNLSRNACWRRVKALESRGVIRGRVALLDPERVGCGLTVLIQIRTNRHDPAWLKAFRDAVETLPEIVDAWRTSGELDYVLRARIADVKAYDRLYQRLIARVSLADVSASFVMEEIKSTTRLPLPDRSTS